MLTSRGATDLVALLALTERPALPHRPIRERTIAMTDAEHVVAYVKQRAAYDSAHRRLNRLLASVSTVTASLSASLEAELPFGVRLPTVEEIAAAQGELRQIRQAMEHHWRDVPPNLYGALVPPPSGEARALPSS